MGYLKYKEKLYDPETGEEIYLDYAITISGLNQEQIRIFRETFRKNNKLNQSFIELINKTLEELGLQRSKSLEDIILQRKNRVIPDYTGPRDKENLESYLESNPREMEVDYIGGGNGWEIRGLYDPSTDTVYILKNQPSHEKRWVYAHERAHRRRHYTGESQNEALVDQEATAQLGYNPFPNRHYGRAA